MTLLKGNVRSITQPMVPATTGDDFGSDALRWDLYGKNLELQPASSRTPANDGDLTIEATNASTLTWKYKSGGTVRSGTIALDPAYVVADMNNATQAIPVSAATLIAMVQTTTNTGSYYSTSTKRYTPPLGPHVVNFAFLLSTNIADGDDVSIGLRKNGALVRQVTQSATQAGFFAIDGVIHFEQTVVTDYWDLIVTIDPASGSSDRTLGSASLSSINNWVIWRQE